MLCLRKKSATSAIEYAYVQTIHFFLILGRIAVAYSEARSHSKSLFQGLVRIHGHLFKLTICHPEQAGSLGAIYEDIRNMCLPTPRCSLGDFGETGLSEDIL
jgi:hypothetical protein